jgi:NAD(P)-dependent dehydrogenase (short-subunit alcohol dehydrogenase family)
MVCRSIERGKKPQQKIIKKTGNLNVDLITCDLGEQAQVRQLAKQLLERYDRIDVLLNNAGVWKAKREITSDGIETTFVVNHLGYFLLSNLLKNRLTESAPSRIINVSSDTHPSGRVEFDNLEGGRFYDCWSAYANSKLANVLFTNRMARGLEGSGVSVNCLEPGWVFTGLAREGGITLKANMQTGGISPAKGAMTAIYCATEPTLESVTGSYFANSRLAASSKESNDTELQDRLWDASLVYCSM